MTTASIIAGDVFELEADECAQTYKADRIGDNDHPIAFQHAIDDPAAYAKSEDHKHFERQIVSGARVPTFLQLRKIRGSRARRSYRSEHVGKSKFTLRRFPQEEPNHRPRRGRSRFIVELSRAATMRCPAAFMWRPSKPRELAS